MRNTLIGLAALFVVGCSSKSPTEIDGRLRLAPPTLSVSAARVAQRILNQGVVRSYTGDKSERTRPLAETLVRDAGVRQRWKRRRLVPSGAKIQGRWVKGVRRAALANNESARNPGALSERLTHAFPHRRLLR